MNIAHLKYAIEVERTGSISRAAESLYMAQPHLSKAIKELEESMGIVIFSRTPKGVVPTKKGKDFLEHAKKIITQIDELEEMYRPVSDDICRFSVCVPRSSYISCAFIDLLRELDFDSRIDVNYRETNSMETIRNVADEINNIGIIRCQTVYEKYFLNCLEERGLKYTTVWKFEYKALMSGEHPLAIAADEAGKDEIDYAELCAYTEIVHGDISVPALPVAQAREIAKMDGEKKKIAVYERASQFEILKQIPNTFMWVSPVPKEVLDRFGLVQKKCSVPKNSYKDILISRKDYRRTAQDRLFLEKLMETIERVKKQRD